MAQLRGARPRSSEVAHSTAGHWLRHQVLRVSGCEHAHLLRVLCDNAQTTGAPYTPPLYEIFIFIKHYMWSRVAPTLYIPNSCNTSLSLSALIPAAIRSVDVVLWEVSHTVTSLSSLIFLSHLPLFRRSESRHRRGVIADEKEGEGGRRESKKNPRMWLYSGVCQSH